MLSLKNKQKGQTLVIVVVLMVVALTIGVAVSTRFVKTLKDVSETDNSSRARAAAEALLERLLIQTNDTLTGYINFNNCGSNCTLTISGFLGQPVTANATLSQAGASNEPYQITAKNGEMSQVILNGYTTGKTLDVCWAGEASVYGSYVYDQSGAIKTSIYAYNPVSYNGLYNGFSDATPMHGYQNCFSITAINTPKLLRLKSLNSDSTIFVFPSSDQTIPGQGILITSVGKAGRDVRTVKVLKTTASAVDFMDYVIYQKSQTDPLSNRPN